VEARVSATTERLVPIAAIREGLETESEQRRFLADGIAPFYKDALTRRVAFGVQIDAFPRRSIASCTAPL
jgi:hypothetical protein